MTSAEWALLVAIGAHAAAMLAAIVKLVAWAASTHARIEQRLNAIEGKVDNDITGRRIVSEMKGDVGGAARANPGMPTTAMEATAVPSAARRPKARAVPGRRAVPSGSGTRILPDVDETAGR